MFLLHHISIQWIAASLLSQSLSVASDRLAENYDIFMCCLSETRCCTDLKRSLIDGREVAQLPITMGDKVEVEKYDAWPFDVISIHVLLFGALL